MSDQTEPVKTEPEAQETQEATKPQETQETTFWAGMAQLPDEYKKDEDIAALGSFGELAKAYKDQKEKLSSYPAPPESPDEYELAPADLPEDMNVDEEIATRFKEAAHEAGLTKEQAVAMQNFFNAEAVNDYNRTKEQTEAQKKQAEDARGEAVKSLRTEWGDKFNEKVELARRTLHGLLFGDKEITEEGVKNHPLLKKIDTTIGNEPEFVKLFAKIGEVNREDAFFKSDGRTATGVNLDRLYPSMKGLKEAEW